MNPDLLRMATGHADVMAGNRILDHDAAGDGTFQSRISSCGYAYGGAGENIAEGQTTVAAAMSSWVLSPPHLANMLNPTWTDAGFAVAKSSDGASYWCADFGRPATTNNGSPKES
jgi:uncharacterized protein YkwD